MFKVFKCEIDIFYIHLFVFYCVAEFALNILIFQICTFKSINSFLNSLEF